MSLNSILTYDNFYTNLTQHKTLSQIPFPSGSGRPSNDVFQQVEMRSAKPVWNVNELVIKGAKRHSRSGSTNRIDNSL